MARKIKKIPLRFKYAVLGDGQTEQYYLKHLKELKGYGYTIRPSFFQKISISEAERIIDELLSGGCNNVIFITDYDIIVNQEKKQIFKQFVEKYKDYPEVLICETMPSIEFWFLLHYQFTTRSFSNAKEAESVLKSHIPNYSKNNSFLKEIKWVEELCKDNKMENAVNSAKKVIKQKKGNPKSKLFPFTKIHLGINEFEKQINKKN